MVQRLTVAAAATALGIAACGGSSAPAALSKSAFLAKAGAACDTVNTAVAALPASAANTAAGENQIVALADGALAKIRALAPPSSLKSAVNTWLADVDREDMLDKQAITAVQTKNLTKAQALVKQIEPLDTKANGEATALGLPSCARTVKPGSGSGTTTGTSTGATTGTTTGTSTGATTGTTTTG